MKTFTLPMAFLATVGAVRAQLSVSDCANMCLSNMLVLAGELGCDDGDLECLCETPNYRYGIRDCTAQACPGDDADAVLNAALEQCPGESGDELTITPDPETETTTGAESASSTIITGSDGTTTLVSVTTTGAESASSTIITGSDGTTTLVPVIPTTGTDSETTTSGSGETTTPGGPLGSSTPGVSPTATSTSGQSTSTGSHTPNTTTLATSTSTSTDSSSTSSGNDSENGSSTSSGNVEESTDAPTGAAPRMAIATGAAGALGLAALLVL